MQTTMIRASMTAYSTAVGPSSFFKKFSANCPSLRIAIPSLLEAVKLSVLGGEPRVQPPSILPKKRDGLRSRSGGRRVQSHIAERVAGIGAEQADRRDADDDDESKHD